jgi:hypothetical protein
LCISWQIKKNFESHECKNENKLELKKNGRFEIFCVNSGVSEANSSSESAAGQTVVKGMRFWKVQK